MAAGEILWYDFEAVTFKLAADCRYTPDFAVMLPSGEIEIHEVKGSKFVIKDDARVKIKVAARLFPFTFKLCIPRTKKEGSGWDITEV